MAGLGLSEALNGYQQGLAWKQGQQELERQKQQRAQLDAANKAATDVIGASQAEWAANGAQGQYKPNSATLFKAAEARSAALARSGMWDAFLENEARVAPMRIQARGEALQRYESDGDIEALVRTTYPTIFDGREVVGVERIEGAPGSENLGLAAIPTKIKLKFSDGKTESVEPQRIVQTVKQSLIDPQVSAKNEIMLNFERAKAGIEAHKQITVEEGKGRVTRENKRAEHQLGLDAIDVKHSNALGLAGLNNEAAQKRAETSAAATRYAADRRATAGGTGGGGGGGGSKGGAPGLQSTKVDSDGYVVGVFRNGDTRRLTDNSGKPIRSGEWSKRVDAVTKTLQNAPGNYGKPLTELRRQAEAAIASGEQKPATSAPASGSNEAKLCPVMVI